MDYLTKWPEVYAAPDQTAPTIVKLLVEELISRHGVPNQLLSDRGPSFLSKLLLGVCDCMGIKKINTSAYHPQSDGLVERFNRTLTDRLAKSVTPGQKEWDDRLPYVLFAYRATQQVSTGESPFFLVYGRDPKLPTETVLCPPNHREFLNLDDYKSVMLQGMSTAWDRAQKSLLKAQKQQKKQHDKAAKNSDFLVGDRVFVCMPAMKTGQLRKLSRPYKGPYRVISTYPNGVKVHPINQPRAEAIRVALNRVRRCPEEIQDCDGAERPSVMATQGMPQDDQYQGMGLLSTLMESK